MLFFSKKQEVSLEDFCRDFYDNLILNPTVGGVNFGTALPDYVIEKIDPAFAHIDKQKLTDELMTLRFELFALAWMHKFVDKFAVAQSVFTKRYLHEKGRDDIWNGMEYYNNAIDRATLNWLMKLGKINLSFWYHVREDLTAKNIEEAKKMGINIDESIDRVNHRLCSENAWKQKIILAILEPVFCKRLSLNPNVLNKEAIFRLAVFIHGLYDGVLQSLNRIKIKH